MAEFCLECFKRDFGNKHYKRRNVVLDWDLCESCGEWKECIVIVKYEHFFVHNLVVKDENGKTAYGQ